MQSAACLDSAQHSLSSKEESRRDEALHPGLPAPLPPGESLVWQGAPRGHDFARQVFHTRLIGLYFAILALWRAASAIEAGRSAGDIALGVLIVVACGALVVGLLELLAWLGARATVYTITNRRIVMRIGAALTKTIDIPFKVIERVELKAGANGVGNISIKLKSGAAIGYLLLWPHVRPWRLRHPEPMLRALPHAKGVAETLAARLRACAAEMAGDEAAAREAPDPEPPARPAPAPAGFYLPHFGAAALVVLSIALVAWTQYGDPGAGAEEARSPVAVHELKFADLGADRIAIVDTGVGETIAVIEAGREGLVRNAVRSLSRTRASWGLPADASYQLIHWDTGRLTLSDLETKRHIPLDSFGPANTGALAQLLSMKDAERPVR